MPVTLLPIGPYPIFIDLCLNNIQTYFGNDHHVVFLGSNATPPEVENKLRKMGQEYLKHSSNTISHLFLLDWAFREISYPKVWTQHADVFWNATPIINKTEYNGVCAIKNKPYFLKDKPFVFLNDYASLYDREYVVKNNLYFKDLWLRDAKLSSRLSNLVDSKQIYFKGNLGTNFIDQNHYLDGGHLLMLEMNLKSDLIFEVDMDYSHFSHFFWLAKHWSSALRLNGKVVVKNKHFSRSSLNDGCPNVEQWAFYSWVSSLVFSVDNQQDYIFPWFLFKRFYSTIDQKRSIQELEIIFSRIISNPVEGSLGLNDNLRIFEVEFEKERNTYYSTKIWS